MSAEVKRQLQYFSWIEQDWRSAKYILWILIRLMSGLWIMLLGGVMFMFVGGEVKHMAFAVGGAILFSGTYSIDFNIIIFK